MPYSTAARARSPSSMAPRRAHTTILTQEQVILAGGMEKENQSKNMMIYPLIIKKVWIFPQGKMLICQDQNLF